MRQSNHALLVYPVVAVLSVAATLPLAMPSMLVGSSSGSAGSTKAVATATPASRVVVVTSKQTTTDPAAAGPNMSDRSGALAPPAGGSDDRWWRAQLDRLATMSIVRFPNSAPKTVPVPPLERVQREAAEAARAAAASPSSPAALVAPPANVGELRLAERVPAVIRRWEPLILRYARKYDVDPSLIAALMQTESGGDPKAVSPMNAIGLLQVLNGPTDPEANIDQGTAMLAGHLRRFGNLNLALAAYNAGPNAVLQYGGIPPYEETYNHVTRTLANYAAYRGS